MAATKHRICILICVFNDQRGLERSLDSIYCDEPLADVLVVDDGSTPAFVLPLSPTGFQVSLLRLDRNVGLAAALNAGLGRILNGNYDYLARLDAGDTVNRGRLRAQAEYLDMHPNIGLLGTQVQAFDQETDQPLFFINNPLAPQAVRRSMKVRNCVVHPSAMIRTAVFHNSGLYDTSCEYGEDYELWRRITCTYDAANLPGVLVNKAMSPSQLTTVYRRAFSRGMLKTQLRFFEWHDLWCWLGIARTAFGMLLPRCVLLKLRTGLALAPSSATHLRIPGEASSPDAV